MKYRKERLFLRVLLPYYKNELLSYTFWNEREKKLVKLVYLDNKSIDNIVINKIMPYEKRALQYINENALSKLNKWIKDTPKIEFKLIYDNLI